jgi:hypothetical protein
VIPELEGNTTEAQVTDYREEGYLRVSCRVSCMKADFAPSPGSVTISQG